MKKRHIRSCRPRPESLAEIKLELAEMKLIAAVVRDMALPASTPLGEIFSLLAKQPQLTDRQKRALMLWEGGHKLRTIFVPDKTSDGTRIS